MNYIKNPSKIPAATAEPITPATLGPMACISTDAEQVVENDHYRIMTNDSKSGKELISGKKIDLTKNMTVGAV